MMTPVDLLTRALVDLATKGQRPRCGDPATHDYWTSDQQAEREQAACWCAGCPVLDECHAAAAANGERFGVWAGVDRTMRPKHRKGSSARPSGRAPPVLSPRSSFTQPNPKTGVLTNEQQRHD